MNKYIIFDLDGCLINFDNVNVMLGYFYIFCDYYKKYDRPKIVNMLANILFKLNGINNFYALRVGAIEMFYYLDAKRKENNKIKLCLYSNNPAHFLLEIVNKLILLLLNKEDDKFFDFIVSANPVHSSCRSTPTYKIFTDIQKCVKNDNLTPGNMIFFDNENHRLLEEVLQNHFIKVKTYDYVLDIKPIYDEFVKLEPEMLHVKPFSDWNKQNVYKQNVYSQSQSQDDEIQNIFIPRINEFLNGEKVNRTYYYVKYMEYKSKYLDLKKIIDGQ